MLLAHLVLKYPELYRVYAKLAIGARSYKMIDNSFVELDLVAMEITELLKAAEIVEADEIVLPELMDPARNLAKIRKIAQDLRGCQYQLQAVLHADSWGQAIDHIKRLCEIPNISVIGLPRPLASLAPFNKGRILLAKKIYMAGKKVHLLGSDLGFSELVGSHLGYIRSMDTSWFVSPLAVETWKAASTPSVLLSFPRPKDYVVNLEAPMSKMVTRFELEELMRYVDSAVTKWGG